MIGPADPPIIGRVICLFFVQVDELMEHMALIDEYIVSEVQIRAWKCKLAGKQTLQKFKTQTAGSKVVKGRRPYEYGPTAIQVLLLLL